MGDIFTTIVTSGLSLSVYFNTPRHRYRVMSPKCLYEWKIVLRLDLSSILSMIFNITNQRVHELCDEIIARGLDILDSSLSRQGIDHYWLK